MAPGHGRLEDLVGVGVPPPDGARFRVVPQDRRLHHDAGQRMNGKERRIGRRALFAQRGQHDRLHLVEAFEHPQQRRVEPAGLVGLGRGHEFVLEAELVEKAPQARVVVRGEAVILAERIGDLGQRLAEMAFDDFTVGNVVRRLAQAVHVVGEGDQPRLDRVAGQHAEGVPHHGRARHLAEGADMRQARRPVAGLEDDFGFFRALETLDQLARLFERPGLGHGRRLAQGLQRHFDPVS